MSWSDQAHGAASQRWMALLLACRLQLQTDGDLTAWLALVSWSPG